MRKTRSNIVEHSHGHIPASVLRTGALSHGLICVASKVSAAAEGPCINDDRKIPVLNVQSSFGPEESEG